MMSMGYVWKKALSSMSTLVLLTTIIIISKDADGILAPAIRIELTQTRQIAYVAPGQDGVVAFTGTVSVTIPIAVRSQYVIVTLSADAMGWPCSVPPSMTFNRDVVQQSFNISVMVPIGTSSAIQGQLVVSGKWHYSPGVMGGNIDPATSTIIIDQYYDYEITCDEPMKEAERSEVENFPLCITNHGNGEDEIAIEVKDAEALEKEGMLTSFSFDFIQLPEASSKDVSLNVKVTDDAPLSNHEIVVSIHSRLAEGIGDSPPTEEMIVYLNIVKESKEPEPGPGEEVDDDMLPDNGQDELHYDDDADGGYNTTYPSDTDGESVNPVMAVLFFIAIVIFAVLIVAFKIGISVYFRYKVFDGFRHHAGLGRNRPLFDILADMGKRN